MPAKAAWTEPKVHRIVATVAECARLIGMNSRTFHHKLGEGKLHAMKDGRWSTKLVCEQLRAEDAARDAKKAERAAASGGRSSEALERKRQLEGDLMAIQLATKRGKLIERSRVHSAFGEVVAIVRAGLMTLPRWGAVNLANLPAEKIEPQIDQKVRALAEDFQKRCGEVKLTAPVAAAKDAKARRAKGSAKTRRGGVR